MTERQKTVYDETKFQKPGSLDRFLTGTRDTLGIIGVGLAFLLPAAAGYFLSGAVVAGAGREVVKAGNDRVNKAAKNNQDVLKTANEV